MVTRHIKSSPSIKGRRLIKQSSITSFFYLKIDHLASRFFFQKNKTKQKLHSLLSFKYKSPKAKMYIFSKKKFNMNKLLFKNYDLKKLIDFVDDIIKCRD